MQGSKIEIEGITDGDGDEIWSYALALSGMSRLRKKSWVECGKVGVGRERRRGSPAAERVPSGDFIRGGDPRSRKGFSHTQTLIGLLVVYREENIISFLWRLGYACILPNRIIRQNAN